MASTVNTAFEEFLKDTVRLDAGQTVTARSSRDSFCIICAKMDYQNDGWNQC